LLTAILGVLLLTILVRRAGPAKLLEGIAGLGWGVSLIIALGGAAHVVKTWSWRLTLLEEKRQSSFMRMLALRLVSEAVGQFGAFGQLFGDTLRVSLLSSTVPVSSGITSVTLDRAFFVVSAAVFTTAGLVALLAILPLPHALSLYAGLFALVLLAATVLLAAAVRRRWAVLSVSARVLGRVRYFSGWVERRRSLIESVENKLLDFYHRTPGAFWFSFALNLAGQCAAILEVYLILWLMGVQRSFLAALAIEALTKLVNVVGLFNPGNVGTYEGGTMLIAKIFGLSGGQGLTLGLTRRIRAIFWAAIGGLCLVLLSKSKKPDHTRTLRETRSENPPAKHSPMVVILANNAQGYSRFGAPHPRIGALPLLLRAILGAQKAGAARIVVVVNRISSPWIRRDLLGTGRLPTTVEWVELGAGETAIPSFLGQLATEETRNVVLIDGDRAYHPSLHQGASGWKGDGDALALVTGQQLAGIYVLSGEVTMELANHGPSNIGCLDDLHAWLMSTHRVECKAVEEDKWQRILTPEDRILAEQKLDRWLVKPTDGIFARLNRRVSTPLSRQAIRFPITPNMVSLFTLFISFIAGLFYAGGGYLYMLLGAIFSLLSSILDGCDGEVARLKLQESDFGCWLDSICDHLYYLFIFAGMMIGLIRTSGTKTYVAWGGLFLFGAILSFLTTSLQRRQLTNGRPEQLLGIWQKQTERRQSNPLLYLARHTEFIIRRCFLPYLLLFFALFNITNVVFVLAAIGVNVVWPMALYSYRAFTPPAPKDRGVEQCPNRRSLTTRTQQLT
jgi:uncharacterized protein (TIRG00374 family)